jgi:hypothetical protein
VATNDWTPGRMYYPQGPPPTTYYTQPGAPFTTVYPQQKNAQPWPEWPVIGQIIQEFAPYWSPACGHSIKEWLVIREYDYVEETSVALICCRVCSMVQGVYRPFEAWLDPLQHAIIVA